MVDIDKIAWKYARQSIAVIAGMTLALLLMMQVLYLDSLLTPIIVGTVFALTIELLDILLWRRIATNSPDSLPMFFLGVSGFRILSAIAVLFVYYFVSNSDMMIAFFLTFMAYYIAIMIHHTLFFAKDRKTQQ